MKYLISEHYLFICLNIYMFIDYLRFSKALTFPKIIIKPIPFRLPNISSSIINEYILY